MSMISKTNVWHQIKKSPVTQLTQLTLEGAICKILTLTTGHFL